MIAPFVDFTSLKNAIPYLKSFKGKIFVVKVGGEICEEQSILDRLIEQLSLLSLLGIRLVVVHGGGKHATKLSNRLGVTSTFVSGRRVTSKEMLEVTKMSFAGELNTEFIAAFKRHNLDAVGLSGIDGGLITAKKRPKQKVVDDTGNMADVDFGYVGDIKKVNTKVLFHLLDGGYTPVICSLASDPSGQVLNINADSLASFIAAEIGAHKLCILGATDGVLRDINDPNSIYSVLTTAEISNLIDNKVATAGMIPKLTTAADAISKGVQRVHIISGVKEDALLQEFFTNEGSGTMIVGDTGASE